MEKLGPAQGVAVVLAVANGQIRAAFHERASDLRVVVQNRQVQRCDIGIHMVPPGIGAPAMCEQPAYPCRSPRLAARWSTPVLSSSGLSCARRVAAFQSPSETL